MTEGLGRLRGYVKALVGKGDVQTLELRCVVGQECGEHRFEFVIAAARQMVGAIKIAHTHPLGRRRRAIKRTVTPSGLLRIL